MVTAAQVAKRHRPTMESAHVPEPSPLSYCLLVSMAPNAIRQVLNEALLRVTLYDKRQLETFLQVRSGLADTYARLAVDSSGLGPFLTPFWRQRSPEMEADLLPYPRADFLNLPSLGAVSVVHYWRLVSYYVRFLERSYDPQRLRRLLREDYLGHPILQSIRYRTSSMTAQHLYHFAYHQAVTKVPLDDVEVVVEFGGGYGNMAKILTRLTGRIRTHVLVDLPLVGAIQWLYLSSILGPESVNVVSVDNRTVIPGKINVMPVSLVGSIGIKPDLFIATWSLSETPSAMQDAVERVGWLRAERLLVAWHRNSAQFPDAERLRVLLPPDTRVVEMEGYYPGNFYGLR